MEGHKTGDGRRENRSQQAERQHQGYLDDFEGSKIRYLQLPE